VRYVVSVSGPTPLLNVSVGETLPVTGLTCSPGGPVISSLNPSADAQCTAQWNAAPGAYTGQATAAGTESLPSISSCGPGPARVARAAVSSRYQFALPTVPQQLPGAATSGSASNSTAPRRHPSGSTADHAATASHASASNHASAAAQFPSHNSTAIAGTAHSPVGGSAPVPIAPGPGTNPGANPSSNPSGSGSGKPLSHANSGTDQTQSLLRHDEPSELPLLFFLLLVVLPTVVTLIFGGGLRLRRR